MRLRRRQTRKIGNLSPVDHKIKPFESSKKFQIPALMGPGVLPVLGARCLHAFPPPGQEPSLSPATPWCLVLENFKNFNFQQSMICEVFRS